jgi:L-threonylcarbamoyladenylate synthase
MTGDIPTILRPGGVTSEMIERVVGSVRLDPGIIDAKSLEKPKSPGMKYTHYAPKGEVIVVSGEQNKVAEWINRSVQGDEAVGKKAAVLAAVEHLADYRCEFRYGVWCSREP